MDNGTEPDAKTPTGTEQLMYHEPELDPGCLILIVGALAYATLCMPAISQRGYPPIDPFWTAIPFLWPLPLILSAIFNSQSDRIRLRAVSIYAIATAFFDSGTFITVVQNHVNPLGMLVFTVLGVGPFHLLVAYILEFLTQIIRAYTLKLLSTHHVWRTVLKWSIAGIILIGTIAAPFAYRGVVFADSRQRARQQAEQNWQERKVYVFKRSFSDLRGNVLLESEFDVETGFPCQRRPRFFGFEQEYNQRVTELIAERGYPEWSMKDDFRSMEVVPNLFNSKEMKAVEFPYEMNAGVNLAFVSKANFGEPAVSLKVVGPNAPDDHPFGIRQYSQITENTPGIEIGHHPQFLDVVFVRVGIGTEAYIEAFHRSGWLLYSARHMTIASEGPT